MSDEPAPLRAAGALLLNEGRVLLLQRAPGSDHAGEWCCPGGGVEGDETAEEAALRELREETGIELDGLDRQLCRRIAEGVDYVTFVKSVPERLAASVDHESSGSGWFPLGELPLPLHPGVAVSLACLAANELDLARMMSAGEIVSPTHYMNVWLFDLRVSGTGHAYRTAGGGEFTFRDPAIYLNDEFLARCNGLPVIWQHPNKGMLTSKEFNDRIVGTILLPYIKGSEVWGVAKIYDDAAVAIMLNKQMSTSPAVSGVGSDKVLDDNTDTEVLIERDPRLLDHLAICEAGVWDKLKPPTGVNVEGADQVTEEEMKADAARKDAEEKARADAARKDADEEPKEEPKADGNIDKVLAKLDAMHERMDGMCSRMDSWEKKDSKKDAAEEPREEGEAAEIAADKRKDSKKDATEEEEPKKEEPKADKKADARKDSEEEKEKEEMKADSAALKGELSALRRQLADLTASQPKGSSEKDFGDTADIQARYDSLYNAMGAGEAPGPRRGEGPVAYRRRLASDMRTHSPKWGAVDLYALPVEAFAIAEEQIYADSLAVAERPVVTEPGRLIERVRTDRMTGLRTITFHGPNTFIAGMKRPPRRASISARRARES
jgi:8-oxo-dGTP pyrophosphatase MutT (NUDIX family)